MEPFLHQHAAATPIRFAMVLSHELFCALFTLLFTWKNDLQHDDEYERSEILECARECIRSILGVVGVHRGSEIFSECWILLTEVKVRETENLQNMSPSFVCIQGAAPSLVRGNFRDLGALGHADILEEEMSSTLEWIQTLLVYHGDDGNPAVSEWLSDLEWALETAHFALKHRSG